MPACVHSPVQVRGSIPLYWVQDTASVSPINPKPAIQLQQYDPHYSATRLHFQVGGGPLTPIPPYPAWCYLHVSTPPAMHSLEATCALELAGAWKDEQPEMYACMTPPVPRLVPDQDLAARYGEPVVVLNLVKGAEKRPRESILQQELASAIAYINKSVRARMRCAAPCYCSLLFCCASAVAPPPCGAKRDGGTRQLLTGKKIPVPLEVL